MAVSIIRYEKLGLHNCKAQQKLDLARFYVSSHVYKRFSSHDERFFSSNKHWLTDESKCLRSKKNVENCINESQSVIAISGHLR